MTQKLKSCFPKNVNNCKSISQCAKLTALSCVMASRAITPTVTPPRGNCRGSVNTGYLKYLSVLLGISRSVFHREGLGSLGTEVAARASGSSCSHVRVRVGVKSVDQTQIVPQSK